MRGEMKPFIFITIAGLFGSIIVFGVLGIRDWHRNAANDGYSKGWDDAISMVNAVLDRHGEDMERFKWEDYYHPPYGE